MPCAQGWVCHGFVQPARYLIFSTCMPVSGSSTSGIEGSSTPSCGIGNGTHSPVLVSIAVTSTGLSSPDMADHFLLAITAPRGPGPTLHYRDRPRPGSSPQACRATPPQHLGRASLPTVHACLDLREVVCPSRSQPCWLRSAAGVRPVAAERSWLISHEAMLHPSLAVAAETTWPVTAILHETGPLKVVGRWRAHRQDNRDSTSRSVPAAMRRGCTRTLRTASAGLNGGETCPLMLFQQSAKLGVLRPQRSLHVVHIAMIVDRDAARQDGTARAATLGPLDPQARRTARACPRGGRL